MADPRFFQNKGPFSLAQLADLSGADIADKASAERVVRDVAPLDLAGETCISFLENTAYIEAYRASAAGACVVHPRFADWAPDGMALLLADKPYRAYALIAQAFYPESDAPAEIAPSAVVDPSARLGDGVFVGANASIGAAVEIGDGTRIGPNAVICDGVTVGVNCRIGAGATVSHALIGDRVVLYPGVRIGQDGFGFAPDPAGHVKVPQIGRVIIGDGCEIGANTTVDRGSLQDTVIGDGCWIDNLVQIGHNVRLGRGCIIVAQVGISGSTKLGNFVAVGGQAGMAGHLTIGDGAEIGAQSGVISDVAPGARLIGSPAVPDRAFFRQIAMLQRLAQNRNEKP